MPGGRKANKSPRGRSQSPRGTKSTRGGGAAAAEDNPFRALAQAEEDITNTDGNTDAEEGKTAEEVDHSDDSAEHVPIGHGGGFPTMAAMQHANPGGVFIPLTHPNYTSFFKKHLKILLRLVFVFPVILSQGFFQRRDSNCHVWRLGQVEHAPQNHQNDQHLQQFCLLQHQCFHQH